jgi:hypothetical protein
MLMTTDTPALPQVRKANRNDEKGLEAFTKGDDKGLEHGWVN